MKKAQILSALALAFALGVVAPVAGANAAIVKIDEKTGALVTDKETTKKMRDEIQAAKESCGWHLVGTGAAATMTYYYDQFLALDTAIEIAENVVKSEKAFLFDATDGNGTAAASQLAGSNFTTDYNAGALKGYYAAVIAQLVTNLTSNSVRLDDSIESTLPNTVTNYDEAVKFINATNITLTNLSNRYNQEVNKNISASYRLAVTQLNGALEAAADELDDVKEIQSDSTVQPKIIAITEADNINTNLTLDGAIAEAGRLSVNNHGTCTLAKALNIEKATDYAESLIESQNSFWASEGEKAIENIKKAMNGTTVTDEDVKQPTPADKDDDKKAPNTGVLSDAEGGASTTVAMVAGVATALTAAGAGVVAYRNARRSSRK